MLIFHLGNTSKLKFTRVNNNLRHANPHLFRSRIKRKEVKCFNDGIAFNAYVLHYSLAKPKYHMLVDT